MAIRETVQAFFLSSEQKKELEYYKLNREKVQAYIREPTALTGPTFSTAVVDGNRGNQFRTYESTVAGLWQRMSGETQYGSDIVRMLVRYLGSWISGNGASINGKTKADSKFLTKFIERNALDSWFLNRIVKGAIIEGRALLLIQPVVTDEDGIEDVQFDIKYLRWAKYKYKIITDPKDDQKIIGMEFRDASNALHTFSPDEFVYINFDNSGQDINKPTPGIDGPALTHCVNLGKAQADWRDYNFTWASIPMHYEAMDRASADELRQVIDDKGSYELGDTLVAPAKAYFPEPSGAGSASIEKEMTTMARILSGVTGVPIYLIGYANDLSNRATAEELTESIYSVSSEPRDILKFNIEELTRKVIIKYNAITGSSMSPEVVVTLAQVTRHQIKELMDIWLPLHDAGHVSQQTLMAKIPGIDTADELKKIEQEKEGNIERQALLIDSMRQAEPEDEEDVA